jgi:hypothetical protein
MKRSTVVGAGGKSVTDNIRTSYGTFIRCAAAAAAAAAAAPAAGRRTWHSKRWKPSGQQLRLLRGLKCCSSAQLGS